MKIVWHGKYCFELTSTVRNQENITVLIDPVNNKFPKKDTNLLLLTHPVEYNKKEKPFTISAAGEYEVGGVFVHGIPSKDKGLIFMIGLEDIKVCHLGEIKQDELTEDQLKDLGIVDVLLIPGGDEDKTKIINQLEPGMVIPMNYSKIETFLKREGKKDIAPVDSIKIQKKDFENIEETEIVVLNEK